MSRQDWPELAGETREIWDCNAETFDRVNISRYATPQVHEGIAIVGQPVPQHYFHRPLNGLLSVSFESGFVVDGLEEPAFGPEDEPTRLQSWANRTEIPPVLVVRVRKLQ